MNKTARAALQVGVSVVLIGILAFVARKQHVAARLAAVPVGPVLLAAGLMAVVWLVNSVRWNLLLRVAGVREKAGTLAGLYFVGNFCSLVLPTGAGGDAVRMWDVARRNGKAAAVVVATLQERLLGMGLSMLVGLAAGVIYFNKLPPSARPALLAVPACAAAAVAVLLYPRVPFAVVEAVWERVVRWGALGRGARRLGDKPLARRLVGAVRPARDLPPLTPARLLPVVGVTLAGVLLSIAVYRVLGGAAGVGVSYTGYCLVVPLVWVISMTPSLGGAGVREGAFVFLLKLFDVPADRSLTVAALFLILQTALACVGGLILAYRVFSGTWGGKPREEPSPPAAPGAPAVAGTTPSPAAGA